MKIKELQKSYRANDPIITVAHCSPGVLASHLETSCKKTSGWVNVRLHQTIFIHDNDYIPWKWRKARNKTLRQLS